MANGSISQNSPQLDQGGPEAIANNSVTCAAYANEFDDMRRAGDGFISVKTA